MPRLLGRFLKLRLQPADLFLAPGPAWSVLCGAIASGRFTLRPENLLPFLLSLFLVDAMMGTLWELAVTVDWLHFWRSRLPSFATAPRLLLPYTLQGSPSYRMAGRLEVFKAWWRDTFWPELGVTWLASLLLAIVLAAILGQSVLSLMLICLVLALIAGVIRLRGGSISGLQALFAVGMSWLIGNAALGPIGWTSVAVGLCYTVVYYAYLIMTGGDQRPVWHLLNWAQLTVVALLVALRQPVWGVCIGLFLVPQKLLQIEPAQGAPTTWYLERTRVLVMGSMVVAALAVS
jgi:hypothetical protein